MSRFLSTLSLRRATGAISQLQCILGDFYPRSPCGERLVDALELADTMLFLSTLSLRRATSPPDFCYLDNIISIHALLAESDVCHIQSQTRNEDFYPRSPCGERQTAYFFLARRNKFLSTLSLRRATPTLYCRNISIHAPCPGRSVHGPVNFYPRSPCGERRGGQCRGLY